MTPDLVREFGLLTLGTRLRRLGERLQLQTQAVLESSDLSVPVSHFPLLAALDRHGALSVGSLAEAIGVSQPAVTRQLGRLEADGLVESLVAAGDQRLREIQLSAAGRQLVTRAKRLSWPAIEAAVADACGADGPRLLAALAALEDALAAEPLDQRAARLAVPKKRARRASA